MSSKDKEESYLHGAIQQISVTYQLEKWADRLKKEEEARKEKKLLRKVKSLVLPPEVANRTTWASLREHPFKQDFTLVKEPHSYLAKKVTPQEIITALEESKEDEN